MPVAALGHTTACGLLKQPISTCCLTALCWFGAILWQFGFLEASLLKPAKNFDFEAFYAT
jgi:hypothetical protein